KERGLRANARSTFGSYWIPHGSRTGVRRESVRLQIATGRIQRGPALSGLSRARRGAGRAGGESPPPGGGDSVRALGNRSRVIVASLLDPASRDASCALDR